MSSILVVIGRQCWLCRHARCCCRLVCRLGFAQPLPNSWHSSIPCLRAPAFAGDQSESVLRAVCFTYTVGASVFVPPRSWRWCTSASPARARRSGTSGTRNATRSAAYGCVPVFLCVPAKSRLRLLCHFARFPKPVCASALPVVCPLCALCC